MDRLRNVILQEIEARTARTIARSATTPPQSKIPTRARKATATGRSFFKGMDGDFVCHFETIAVTTPNQDAWQQRVQIRDLFRELQNPNNRRLIDAVRTALKGDLGLFCNDPSFKYWGYEYILTQRGDVLAPPGGETRPPNIRNPGRQGVVCKHLFQIMQALPWFAPELVKYLREHPEGLSPNARRAVDDFERTRGTGPYAQQRPPERPPTQEPTPAEPTQAPTQAEPEETPPPEGEPEQESFNVFKRKPLPDPSERSERRLLQKIKDWVSTDLETVRAILSEVAWAASQSPDVYSALTTYLATMRGGEKVKPSWIGASRDQEDSNLEEKDLRRRVLKEIDRLSRERGG